MKKRSYIPVLFMIFVAKMLPFNWIIGSYHATFSWTTMLAPALVKHYGFPWISLFFISKTLFSASWMFSLLHRTPLLFSAYAYRQRHWLTSFLIPAACMLLFVMHEVGSVAWCYSLYWLIPMILYFCPNVSVTRALSSSFVAHAVGSVIWLYTKMIPAKVWIALIPVVACERLLMAGGIVMIDVLIVYGFKLQIWNRACKILGWA